ncbi:unnamed protein product [Urochloa humidicola]
MTARGSSLHLKHRPTAPSFADLAMERPPTSLAPCGGGVDDGAPWMVRHRSRTGTRDPVSNPPDVHGFALRQNPFACFDNLQLAFLSQFSSSFPQFGWSFPVAWWHARLARTVPHGSIQYRIKPLKGAGGITPCTTALPSCVDDGVRNLF